MGGNEKCKLQDNCILRLKKYDPMPRPAKLIFAKLSANYLKMFLRREGKTPQVLTKFVTFSALLSLRSDSVPYGGNATIA